MLNRVITWIFFGLTLSLTPLIIVAALGWTAESGQTCFPSSSRLDPHRFGSLSDPSGMGMTRPLVLRSR